MTIDRADEEESQGAIDDPNDLIDAPSDVVHDPGRPVKHP